MAFPVTMDRSGSAPSLSAGTPRPHRLDTARQIPAMLTVGCRPLVSFNRERHYLINVGIPALFLPGPARWPVSKNRAARGPIVDLVTKRPEPTRPRIGRSPWACNGVGRAGRGGGRRGGRQAGVPRPGGSVFRYKIAARKIAQLSGFRARPRSATGTRWSLRSVVHGPCAICEGRPADRRRPG